MSEYSNNYPVVLVHGFTGWGDRDKLNNVFPYWFRGLVPHLEEQGLEVYTPSLGPFTGTWDRCCELWAYLFGGTVDYGKVHSEKCGHARFGRTYQKGVLEDLGTTEAHKKIHLLGHSFGGPTVKVFAELCANGSAEEREATPAEQLSPLFAGGHGNLLHTVTTLSGVNNGTFLAEVAINVLPTLMKGMYVAMQPLQNTPFMKAYDIGQQQYGLGEYPEHIHGIHPISPKKALRRIDTFAHAIPDSMGLDASISHCSKWNKEMKLDNRVFYFAQRAISTKEGKNGKLKPVMHNPITYIGAVGMVRMNGMRGDKGYLVDDSWFPTDGFVNVVGQSAPLDVPHEDATYDTDFKPGIWYNMPLVEGDHMFWNGMSGKKSDVFGVYDKMFDIYRRLPDID